MNNNKDNKIEDRWREKLTPEQYRILREKGTETPFSGKYTRTKNKGIYKCVACGNELFSSDTKFDSGTGWPSFTQPMKFHPYYVYVLRMSNKQMYVGSTNDLMRRVNQHKNGKVFTTRKFLPVMLIYYEVYASEQEARNREKNLKYHGSAFAKLKDQIANNPEISLAGFTDPTNLENIELKEDKSHSMTRTEVLCKKCGSHLGHVFDDLPAEVLTKAGGPAPHRGRYCINSVCLELEPFDSAQGKKE